MEGHKGSVERTFFFRTNFFRKHNPVLNLNPTLLPTLTSSHTHGSTRDNLQRDYYRG